MADSIGNLALVDGHKANLSINGKTVTALDTGKTFAALIQGASPADISAILGTDQREKASIAALRENVPAELLAKTAKSQVRAQIDGATVILTRRDDSIGTPFVTFDVMKIL